MICILGLALPRQHTIQATEHFGPSSIAHLLGTSDVVCGGGSPKNFVELPGAFDVLSLKVHCVYSLDLEG